jgi:hypothetical protein
VKQILILYPIAPYIEALLGKGGMTEEKMASIRKRYQEIMAARYPFHRRVWVFFSKEGAPKEPNLALQWKHLVPNEGDATGTCGVSFTMHCNNRVYPHEEDVLALCQHPVEELIVCGFHLWDCVDGIARYAYEQGILVRVDEDLTELFFYGFSGLDVPISLKESVQRRKEMLSQYPVLFEKARRERASRPWLPQL